MRIRRSSGWISRGSAPGSCSAFRVLAGNLYECLCRVGNFRRAVKVMAPRPLGSKLRPPSRDDHLFLGVHHDSRTIRVVNAFDYFVAVQVGWYVHFRLHLFQHDHSRTDRGDDQARSVRMLNRSLRRHRRPLTLLVNVKKRMRLTKPDCSGFVPC